MFYIICTILFTRRGSITGNIPERETLEARTEATIRRSRLRKRSGRGPARGLAPAQGRDRPSDGSALITSHGQNTHSSRTLVANGQEARKSWRKGIGVHCPEMAAMSSPSITWCRTSHSRGDRSWASAKRRVASATNRQSCQLHTMMVCTSLTGLSSCCAQRPDVLIMQCRCR